MKIIGQSKQMDLFAAKLQTSHRSHYRLSAILRTTG
jgi:hypothetical protein